MSSVTFARARSRAAQIRCETDIESVTRKTCPLAGRVPGGCLLGAINLSNNKASEIIRTYYGG